jgi:hypothetical protein
MTILSKADSSMQRIAPGEVGPEIDGWYREPPKVGQTFAFWQIGDEGVDKDGVMKYCETSEVVSVFGSLDGYIIKTKNSVYVIREFLDG